MHHDAASLAVRRGTMITLHDPESMRGATVRGPDGDKIGTVDELYFDPATDRPEWMTVKTGLFGMRTTFVPLEGARPEGEDELRIPYEKDRVKDAPSIDPDHELTQSEEQRLYSFYGLSYGEQRSSSGLPQDREGGRATEGRDVSGPTTDEAMTRSEEELRVGTERRESGRVRLRKYVVTETVTKSVPVQREEVRLEREPITEGNVDEAMSGPAISEEEHEVVLHEEEPVVEKRAVPKERVRLEKDTEVGEETVSEEVRKERIETEGDRLRDRDD
jgi:uncharacterized protein (TIGR02271 family)